MHMYVFGFIERCFAKITVFNLDFQLYYLVALFSAVHPVVTVYFHHSSCAGLILQIQSFMLQMQQIHLVFGLKASTDRESCSPSTVDIKFSTLSVE